MQTAEFKELLHQGICAYQKKEYESALQYFEKLQELYPHEKIAPYSVAVALEALDRWNEAEAYMKKVVKLDPDFPDGYHHLAYIAANQEQFEIARGYYAHTIAIEPENINAHYNLGVMQKLLGLKKEARESFRNALSVDPDYIFARQHLVTMYLEEGKFDLAKKELDLCLSVNPQDPLLHATYASYYQEVEDYNKALLSIEEALKHDEKNIFFLLQKADLLYQSKKYEESICLAQSIIAERSDFAECFELMGDNFLALNRLEEAKKVYAKALKLKPELQNTCKGIQQLFPEKNSLEDERGTP